MTAVEHARPIQTQPGSGRQPQQRTGPLAGVRIADFCWMGVGAVATRMLADFGAEVIKIEARDRLDMPRRLPIYKNELRSYGDEDPNPDPNKGGLFNNYSRNKLGITVNMKTERGQQLVRQLIGASSVVTENFAPGVMEKWGLTYDDLRAIDPEIILARMSGFGHSGPHHRFKSYGPVIQAVCGLSFISGLPDREPSGWGLSYMDNQAAYYNSMALLMAIMQRNVTGKGQEIDVSAVEAGINLIGPDLLDVSVNNAKTRRPGYPNGNRLDNPQAAPHGVYPAAGEDKWLAIAVFDDADWSRFASALGNPEWASSPDFADQSSRFANHDKLDEHISRWSARRPAHESMELLQAAGVAAGAVRNSQDLTESDPQINLRETFFELDHPVIGVAKFEGSPMQFSRTVQDNWRSAPLLGEDNQYVFGNILGLDEDEIAVLTAEGVI
ncbi:CaiB/BaiF CoA transferase family protein [Rhodococcus sp. OK302]|uniref:CaiB/BaiF CoA transferase family protein n=1 Tax=Rhodococcus sp. OK302 TaxID=1882769 RepID=UPI000B9F64F2|nr:CoA transferase [Rhodococcus sp. OK302]OYD61404.1 crotonobetainyl-CoA:carnitine CoA-transferase CaiB-like acyl-CoA transferase [Rhodococcus sp. OK302]